MSDFVLRLKDDPDPPAQSATSSRPRSSQSYQKTIFVFVCRRKGDETINKQYRKEIFRDVFIHGRCWQGCQWRTVDSYVDLGESANGKLTRLNRLL